MLKDFLQSYHDSQVQAVEDTSSIPRLIISESRNTDRCVGIHSFPTSDMIRTHKWMVSLQHLLCFLWRPSQDGFKGDAEFG
jgi:hypothetical protein